MAARVALTDVDDLSDRENASGGQFVRRFCIKHRCFGTKSPADAFLRWERTVRGRTFTGRHEVEAGHGGSVTIMSLTEYALAEVTAEGIQWGGSKAFGCCCHAFLGGCAEEFVTALNWPECVNNWPGTVTAHRDGERW